MKKLKRNNDSLIYLRPILLSDTEKIVYWRNQNDVRKNFIFQELFTKEMHENWFNTKVLTGKVIQMIICAIDNDKPLGSVYIQNIDKIHKKAEFGIFIGEKSARGCGVGTTATKIMIKYCFEFEKLHRLYLRVFEENQNAICVYKKAGFIEEGLLKDDVNINGEYRNIILMGIINNNDGGGYTSIALFFIFLFLFYLGENKRGR